MKKPINFIDAKSTLEILVSHEPKQNYKSLGLPNKREVDQKCLKNLFQQKFMHLKIDPHNFGFIRLFK